ncbi:hypothetical protein D049_2255B, partial [Vibrio parahaemolyticus VPTS-2010]
ALLRFLFV